jgi:hypothetical protein
MREIRSYGSVGERGGNEPLYPERDEAIPQNSKSLHPELGRRVICVVLRGCS